MSITTKVLAVDVNNGLAIGKSLKENSEKCFIFETHSCYDLEGCQIDNEDDIIPGSIVALYEIILIVEKSFLLKCGEALNANQNM